MKEEDILTKCQEVLSMYNETLEPEAPKEMTSRVIRILDAKYKKANLEDVVAKCTHLMAAQQQNLLDTLNKYKPLFDGALGDWQTTPVDLQLKEDAKTFYLKPHAVPHIHLETPKKDVERLCNANILWKVNDDNRQYVSPSFIIPKKNSNVRLVSDF